MIRRLFVLLLFFVGGQAGAQSQDGCSTPRSIGYPVDTPLFTLVQDFGTASPRHQGRYHTGEDWFAGMGTTLGQPVRAAASGVVTYSAPNGWGPDGGVVILRHILADGAIYYTQYGHLAETETVTFPPRLSCVEMGDILGVIGDARPAPHLHFEVRTNQPDIAGPGYTRENPETLGWLRPAQVIANLQARFNTAYRWHFTNGTFTGNPAPLVLNDHSLLLIDHDRARRLTPDGRVLWRTTLPHRAVGVAGYQAGSYVIDTAGTVRQIDVESGTLGQAWQIDDFLPDMSPLLVGSTQVYHTADDTLVALSPDMRGVNWRLEGIPAYDYGYVAGALFALVVADEIWLISHDGALVGQAHVHHGANFSTAPDGTLIVYTHGGLWRVDADGRWSEVMAGLPPGGDDTGAIVADDGRVYVASGTTLSAYTTEGTLVWQAALPQRIIGRVSTTQYGATLLITGNHGAVIAAHTGGKLCGATRLYGNDSAGIWHALGGDGLLRVVVGDQVLGLDWRQFTDGC